LQGPAQTLHGRIDTVVKLDSGVIRPQLLPDFFPQQHFARIFQQLDKYAKGLLL
jgi:hypothetical protein